MKLSLEIVTGLISIVTFFGGVVMWYSGAIKKTYAAQRDYEHLKNSYKQLANNQDNILKEFDTRFDQIILEMKELKGLITAVLVKISPNEHSTGWYRRNDQP
jgi:hypothetical protein